MESGHPIYRYASDDLVSDQNILKHYPGANGESVMFCDLSDVIFKWSFWRENMPRVHPYYAVKCNYDPLLLRTLAQLGAGFDCASQSEIEMVQKFNVDPAKIIYAQPVKFVPHLKFAEATGTDLVTFDRKSELEKIRTYTPNARCILRIRYDAKDVLFKMGDKFGCDPVTEGPELLRYAKELNLNVVGTSFHVGTGCNDIESYRMAIWACKVLTDYGRNHLGYDMYVVDIGGGFHGTKDNNFRDIAQVINTALEEFFPAPENIHMANWQIIAEPGQFFTTSAFTLFATVRSSRLVNGATTGDAYMEYIIDDGVYNSFRSCPEILKFLQIESVGNNRTGPMMNSVILGQCPDERDFIAGGDCFQLPVLQPGDVIVFRNMGSYSLSMRSSYAKFTHPVVKYFIKHSDADRICLDNECKAGL